MTTKKSQMAIFLILGIALLLIAGVVIITTKSATEKKGKTAVQTSATTSTSETLTKFVESCMENTLKKGVYLLGMQGGHIESSQGGPYGELTPSLQTTIAGKTYKVRFGIKTNPLNPNGFPNFDQLNAKENSFQLHLESYVKNNIGECLDFTPFEESEEVAVTTGKNKTEITIRPEEVVFSFIYPLHVVNERMKEDYSLDSFKVVLPSRLGKMHEILENYLLLDLNEPDYSLPEGEVTDGIKLQIDRTTHNPRDLITLTDSAVLLSGKHFSLRTARANRPPVLATHYDFPCPSILPFTLKETDLNYKGKNQGKDSAADPDEDSVIITYNLDLDGDQDFETPVLSDGIVLNGQAIRLHITATTSDNLKDSQEIKICQT